MENITKEILMFYGYFWTRITFYLCFILITSFMEAMIYSQHPVRKQPRNKYDEHLVYSMLRGFIIVFIFMFDWRGIIGSALIFPFFHDGLYYCFTNWLHGKNIYPGWFLQDMPIASTSKFSFNFMTRFLLFLIGCTIYVYGFYTADIYYELWKLTQ